MRSVNLQGRQDNAPKDKGNGGGTDLSETSISFQLVLHSLGDVCTLGSLESIVSPCFFRFFFFSFLLASSAPSRIEKLGSRAFKGISSGRELGSLMLRNRHLCAARKE